ncbi:MAG: demethoxyubiquinone hydroxylase family protein [Alphaproteobacteria bacterium]|nr:demethoxyubiquinone hydroxylase family protein [Alphaproteobacteria bacterium]
MPMDSGARRRLAEMIRVDHAGEFGAVQIYRGQRAVFAATRGKAQADALIADMEAGEAAHLETFDRLIAERNVRPTMMAPLWRIAGFGLGAATALMGEKAAHACTAAVEEVIEDHYAKQAEELRDADPELRDVLERFRADEMGHRDTAIAHGARETFGYAGLSAVIKFGCRAAIRISEKA